MEPEERLGSQFAGAPRGVPARSSVADEFLDELLPERFEWRRMVRRYPLPALVLAAIGGYWLGSRRGEALVAAAAAQASDAVDRRLDRILDFDSD
jgi:hypothetical protein